jgi:hypothetical protein
VAAPAGVAATESGAVRREVRPGVRIGPRVVRAVGTLALAVVLLALAVVLLALAVVLLALAVVLLALAA